MSECGFPPARLEIEITEDALVSDIAMARTTLVSLKNLGVRVALDDFGTGYSSLRHLHDLPFDVLKIDQSFVQTMGETEDGLIIVKAVLDLAKNLKLGVTAEGVETESQARILQTLGCETVQGYYFGRPSPFPSSVNLGGVSRPLQNAAEVRRNSTVKIVPVADTDDSSVGLLTQPGGRQWRVAV